jgi:hypothetical protein
LNSAAITSVGATTASADCWPVTAE